MESTLNTVLNGASERLRVSINLKIDYNLGGHLRDSAWVGLGALEWHSNEHSHQSNSHSSARYYSESGIPCDFFILARIACLAYVIYLKIKTYLPRSVKGCPVHKALLLNVSVFWDSYFFTAFNSFYVLSKIQYCL